MTGLPYDADSGTIPNQSGRVTGTDGTVLEGTYVVGWAKRGANGVIGTNKQDAADTVALLVSDLLGRGEAAVREDPLPHLLGDLGKASFREDWLEIDAAEIGRGTPHGRPRVKFVTRDELTAAYRAARST